MGEITAWVKRARSMAVALVLLTFMVPAAFAAALPQVLIPVGQTVGIDVQCDGVMVVALNEVSTADGGTRTPALEAGLVPGDVITQVGATQIASSAEFKTAIEAASGEAVTIRVLRGGQQIQLNLTPVEDGEGGVELGLWLRDGMAGIGTVTFFDPVSGVFGALGHSVSDVETGVLMPLGNGAIMPAAVKSIIRGEAGMPGELQGEFNFSKKIGSLYANTPTGIYGVAGDPMRFNQYDALPVAGQDEIELGAATILANIEGTEVKEFDIEISRIFSGGDERNVMITVTDPELIAQTGGIVQGMSGSPIMQNGKLIGAVTHVLINNPQKGYGISIERMLDSAFGQAQNQAA